ncbi:MAG: cytochrome c maturation protein CcmE [Rhodospirillales bacterium]|nr:cytochrome c maturation protein CcmE [Rhodospirillales bacterium]MBO6788176.1 cytochrome c maturation protein CcmE [Rhodospirillales bacterium]
MKRKHKRLTFVLVALVLLGGAATLVLNAFEENIVFFMSPSDIAAGKVSDERRFRLGGLVEDGSVDRSGGETVQFRVTDTANVVKVSYTGILPDLFREGQGVVAEGRIVDGVFVADEVLAKHDENYMPPEVADAIKKSGQWQGSEN